MKNVNFFVRMNFTRLAMLMVFCSLLAGRSLSQTTLSQGDLSLLAFRTGSSGSDLRGFTFVTWVQLQPNTVIKFTDNGFNYVSPYHSNTSMNYRCAEQTLVWTSPSGSVIPAGTVVVMNGITPTVDGVTTGTVAIYTGGTTAPLSSMAITGSGDNLFAYQSTSDVPPATSNDATFSGTLLYGLGWTGSTTTSSNWLTSGAATSGNSNIPTDLPSTYRNFFTLNTGSAQYSGSRTGETNLATYKAMVNNFANWTTYPTTAGAIPLNGSAFLAGSAATINAHPSNASVCTGISTTFTVSASNAASYKWQYSSTGTGGTYVDVPNSGVYSGVTNSTLSISNVAGLNGYAFRAVVTGTNTTTTTSNGATLTVNPSPSFTSHPSNSTICQGANTSFSAAASDATSYQWYYSTDGGSNFSPVANGGYYSNATTTTLQITGAAASLNGYQFRLRATGSCSPVANSNTVVLTVNDAPVITGNPSNSTICAGANTIFTASAAYATSYQWQVNTGSGFNNVINGGVYSGATTTTLTITGATAGMNGYQYQMITSGSCSPSATSNAAALTVNSAPLITSQPSNSTICAGSNTSFTVSAANVTGYQWQVNTGSGFNNITNGGVYSGASTTTLSLTGATAGMNGYLYRVVASGSCTPSATSNNVALTVNSAPAFSANPQDEVICENDNVSFSASAINATGYQWQVDMGSGFASISDNGVYSGTTTSTLSIAGASVSMNGYAYRAVATGSCTPSATSSAATLTVYTLVTYYFDNDGDGYGDPFFTTQSCTGAPFMFVANSLDCNDYDNTIYPFAPEICGDGIDNDCDGDVDEDCVPTTQITSTHCGQTINYTDAYVIEADEVVDADLYEFRITSGAFTATATDTLPEIKMVDFAGYQYGVTYDIDVRVEVDGVWGDWGTACQISTVAVPVTEPQSWQCNQPLQSISTPIFANTVDGATMYRFRVINGANVQVIDKTIHYFALNQLASYDYGMTYTVDVAVEVNGSFSAYGPACNVIMLPLKTKIQNSQCGSTVANMSTAIYANNVSGATAYRFRVTNGANVQIIDRPTRWFSLNQLPTFEYGTTYSVDVAIEMHYSGSLGDYGVVCTITTPATAPLTQVQSSQCGTTLPTLATPILANNVVDATQYRFRVTNGATVQTIDKPSRSFSLTELPTYATSTTYAVDVALFAAGSWGAYGPACNVTTPDTISKVRASQCGVTLTSISTAIYADVVTGATIYRFRVINGANVQTIDRPSNSFTLSQLTSYGYGITYTIDVSVERNGSFSPYGAACNVSTPVLVTKVQPSQCGVTVTNIGTLIYANNVAGATTYRFRVINGANVQILDRPVRSFSLNQLPVFAGSTTYTIDVAVEMNGTFGAYGTACNVTSPSGVLTQVQASQCGTTLAALSTTITADAVANATQYRFRVTEGANVQTIDKATASFNLTELSNYAYSTNYAVEVATMIGGNWGAYGPICHVTTPQPVTKVVASQCGTTLPLVSTEIHADAVYGATQYRFRVTNGANVQTIDKATASFSLTELTYAYSTAYSIDVAVMTGGNWSAYGPVCVVTTPGPSTQVRASQCGVTLVSIGTVILADAFPGATTYRFRVTNGASVQTIDKTSNSFAINQLATYAYGTTYTVEVAVEVGGVFGSYGAPCSVTTPKLTTKIRNAQCGITLATISTLISANSVTGGTQYRFRVTNGANVQIIDRPTYSFTLTQLASYAYNTTYSIDVAVETNGTFGPYGAACDITTPSSGAKGSAGNGAVSEMKAGSVEGMQFDAVTFPNPFSNEFGVSVSTESDEMISVTVYDMTGKVLSMNTVSPQEIGNLQLGTDFASGIYQVQVVQGTDVKTLKVVKK